VVNVSASANGNESAGDNVNLSVCQEFKIDVSTYSCAYHDGLILDGCKRGVAHIISAFNAGYGVGLVDDSGTDCRDIVISGSIYNNVSHGLYGKDALYIVFNGEILDDQTGAETQDTGITTEGTADYWVCSGLCRGNVGVNSLAGANNDLTNLVIV